MDNPKAAVRKTKNMGHAIFAVNNIRAGEIIAEFDGKFYTNDFSKWSWDANDHAIQYGPRKWRDSKGIARYLNHSCEPNCGVKNLFQVVAMRDIKKGEHITWDYEMTERNRHWVMHCRCGEKNCRGEIGNFENMPLKLHKKYKGFISDWLIEFLERKKRSAKRKKI